MFPTVSLYLYKYRFLRKCNPINRLTTIWYRVKYSKAAAAVAAMNQLFQRPLCSESSHNTTIAALDNIFRRGHNTVSFFFDDATQRRRPIWFTKRV